MTTVIDGNGDVAYTNNELVKEMVDNGEASATRNSVFGAETKAAVDEIVEKYRVDKRLLQELKHTLEFYASFQNFAMMMDTSDKNEPTLLGVHRDSGSTFNVFVKKVNDEFVYDLHIAINETPMVKDKPNTLATHTLEYAQLSYRELGLVLNNPVTLNRLAQRSVYETEDDFVKTVYGQLRRR